MKILFLSHYSFLYGSNRSLDSLIDYFCAKGHDVYVLLPKNGVFKEHLENKGVKVFLFRFFYEALFIKWNKKYLAIPILLLYDIIAFPFLLKKIKSINPDLIYTNSSMDAFSIWIAKILKKRHIIHIREYMDEDFGAHFILGKKARRAYILKSDNQIFVSKSVACSVVGSVPPSGRVIYNGLKKPAHPSVPTDIRDKVRIGVVGNLDISKQQHLAIQALPEILKVFPCVELHIVGDKECPYKKYLFCLVKKLKVKDAVVFDGYINDVEEIYSKFDILLMCSRSEAFGRVTIEAMMRRKPVIGFNSGGTTELINQGETGFLFSSVSEIISALHILIEDSDRAQEIISKAEKQANEMFNEERYARDVYNFVIDEQ